MQSVAVRIIVDREEEIKAFKPEEYWSIDGKFAPAKGTSRKQFLASLYGTADGQKLKISKKEEADKITEDLKKGQFIVKSIKTTCKNKKEAPMEIRITATPKEVADIVKEVRCKDEKPINPAIEKIFKDLIIKPMF